MRILYFKIIIKTKKRELLRLIVLKLLTKIKKKILFYNTRVDSLTTVFTHIAFPLFIVYVQLTSILHNVYPSF